MADVSDRGYTKGDVLYKDSNDVPSFFAELEMGHTPVQVKQSDLTSKTLTFTWDFKMTDGVKFVLNPTRLTTVYDLISTNFKTNI